MRAVDARRGASGRPPAEQKAGAPSLPRNRYVVFLLIAVGGCLLDLITKRWIFARLGMPRTQPTLWIWQGVFGFQTSLNEGALFGMGQGCVTLFAILSIAIVPCILYWLFVARAARDFLLTVALALVTAGILGNLYDRLGLPGLVWRAPGPLHAAGDPVYAVRDWILVMIGNFHWPNFNIADSMLVCGAILLVWHAFGQEADKGPNQDAKRSSG
jgi:signal peptidase II